MVATDIAFGRTLVGRRGGFLEDSVAKVESCRLRICRENTKQEAIADSYNLSRVTEVASEFGVGAMRSLTSLHENRAYRPQNF